MDSIDRFFGYVLIVAGVIILLTGGACTLELSRGAIFSLENAVLILGLLVLPLLIGLPCILKGRALLQPEKPVPPQPDAEVKINDNPEKKINSQRTERIADANQDKSISDIALHSGIVDFLKGLALLIISSLCEAWVLSQSNWLVWSDYMMIVPPVCGIACGIYFLMMGIQKIRMGKKDRDDGEGQ